MIYSRYTIFGRQERHQFNQLSVINALETSKEPLPKLRALVNKYDGLCDVICNYVVKHNLLSDDAQVKGYPFNTLRKSSPGLLNELENEMAPLHTISRLSYFQLFKAKYFNKFESNLLSPGSQKKLFNFHADEKWDDSIEAITRALNKMQVNQYVKFIIFENSWLSLGFSGHTMLIRKCDSDKFTFFDPNKGSLSFDTIADFASFLRSEATKRHDGYHLCFLDIDYLNNDVALPIAPPLCMVDKTIEQTLPKSNHLTSPVSYKRLNREQEKNSDIQEPIKTKKGKGKKSRLK